MAVEGIETLLVSAGNTLLDQLEASFQSLLVAPVHT